MKAVVVIPTYNEKNNIILLLNKLHEVAKKIKGWRLEFLVVDDNSPDGTAKTVHRYALAHKKTQLLLRKGKSGLGAAYLAGMTEAFGRLGADAVIVMDADLSHNPFSIPEFLKKIEDGTDMVIGSRYIKGGSTAKGWAPHRVFLSVFGNKTVSLFLGSGEIKDWTSGYRGIKKEVFLKVLPFIKNKRELKGYTFNISFAYYATICGFRVGSVPIRFADRTRGKSKLGFEYLFNTPIFLLKTRLSQFFRV